MTYSTMIIWTGVGALSFGMLSTWFTVRLFQTVSEEIKTGVQRDKSASIVFLLSCLLLTAILSWVTLGFWPSAQQETRPAHYVNDFDTGKFGDQFGFVNSLFTSLAFAGVLIAIVFQGIELRYQRAEMNNTRKVFMNTYHLQALQVYMNSLPDALEKHQISRDLLDAIRTMRLSGDIDEYQLFPVQQRAVFELESIQFRSSLDQIIAETDITKCSKMMDDLYGALLDIDDRNVGNGILLVVVSSISDAARELRQYIKKHPALDKGGLHEKQLTENISEMCRHILGKYETVCSFVKMRHAREVSVLQNGPFGPRTPIYEYSLWKTLNTSPWRRKH